MHTCSQLVLKSSCSVLTLSHFQNSTVCIYLTAQEEHGLHWTMQSPGSAQAGWGRIPAWGGLCLPYPAPASPGDCDSWDTGLKPGSSGQKIYKTTLRLPQGAHKAVGAQMAAPSPLSLLFLSPSLPAVTQKQGWFVFKLCTSCRSQSSPHLKSSKKLIFQSVFLTHWLSRDKRILSTLFLLHIRSKNGTERDFVLCYFFPAHVVWEVSTELKDSCCG